jgi:Ras-related protein Rab-8A
MHADVNVNKILIGNKCDIKDLRQVSYEEGEALAKEYNTRFFETSAKQDMNVETSFLAIASDVKNRILADMEFGGTGNAPQGHKIGAGSANKKQGCC